MAEPSSRWQGLAFVLGGVALIAYGIWALKDHDGRVSLLGGRFNKDGLSRYWSQLGSAALGVILLGRGARRLLDGK